MSTLTTLRLDSGKTKARPSSEALALIAIFALFLALNFLTLANFPVPWNDEIMYADPALNMAAGRGLTSGTWYASHVTDHWANNTPLYVLLLAIPAAAEGSSLVALRSVNLMLAGGAVFLLWLTARRNRWFAAPERVLFAALGLGGYGILFCYRSIRPDCVSMFVCAAALYCVATEDHPVKKVGAVLSGALIPLAGLQTVLLVPCYLCLNLWRLDRKRWPRLLVFICGCAAGGTALIGYYVATGEWTTFLRFTVGYHTPLGSRHFAWRHASGWVKDPSLYLVILLGLLAAGHAPARLRISFILHLLLIPAVFVTLGIMPIYYSWMIYFPLALLVCHAWSQTKMQSMLRAAAFAGAAAPLLVLTAFGMYIGTHNGEAQRDRALGPYIKATDNAYSDPAAYFVARQRTKGLVYGGPFDISKIDLKSLNLAMLEQSEPSASDAAQRLLMPPAAWDLVDCVPKSAKTWTTGTILLRNPQVCIYRRTAEHVGATSSAASAPTTVVGQF